MNKETMIHVGIGFAAVVVIFLMYKNAKNATGSQSSSLTNTLTNLSNAYGSSTATERLGQIEQDTGSILTLGVIPWASTPEQSWGGYDDSGD